MDEFDRALRKVGGAGTPWGQLEARALSLAAEQGAREEQAARRQRMLTEEAADLRRRLADREAATAQRTQLEGKV